MGADLAGEYLQNKKNQELTKEMLRDWNLYYASVIHVNYKHYGSYGCAYERRIYTHKHKSATLVRFFRRGLSGDTAFDMGLGWDDTSIHQAFDYCYKNNIPDGVVDLSHLGWDQEYTYERNADITTLKGT